MAIVTDAGCAEKEEVIEATLGAVLDRIKQEELPFEYLIYIGEFLTHRYQKPQARPAD